MARSTVSVTSSLFEKRMLSRSSRAVLGSARKSKGNARHLCYNRPGASVQGEAEFDRCTVPSGSKGETDCQPTAGDKEGLTTVISAVVVDHLPWRTAP